MESPEVCLRERQGPSFLALPYEIRLEIYTLALDYPDLKPVFEKFESQYIKEQQEQHEETKLPICALPTPHVPLQLKTTPGILLCNRQIYWEARQVMHNKTLTLRRSPPHTVTLGGPMDITEFISEDTLHQVRRLELFMKLCDGPHGDISGWCKMMEVLLDVWSAETHLEEISVNLYEPGVSRCQQIRASGTSNRGLRLLTTVRVRFLLE